MAKKTNKTKEQLEKEYADKWIDILVERRTTDDDKAKELCKAYYVATGNDKDLADIIMVDTPAQGAALCHFLQENSGKDEAAGRAEARRMADSGDFSKCKGFSINSSTSSVVEANWLFWHEMHRDHFGEKMDPGFEEYANLVKEVSWVFTFSDVAILVRRPELMVIKDNSFSSYEGPVIHWEAKNGNHMTIYSIDNNLLSEEEWRRKSAPHRCTLGKTVFGDGFGDVKED